MRVPAGRRAELYAEGLQRIAVSGQNDYRRFLLAECLEAYAELDEAEKARLQALLTTEQYQEVKPLMTTTYERGLAQGVSQGVSQGILQGERNMALLVLEEKFGPLPPALKQRAEGLSPDELRQLLSKALKAGSLEELNREG